MRIQVLTAEGVRNLRPLALSPRERFNVFVGDNGQGKTNLLEAIYVAASLRSFRTSKLSDLIAFDRVGPPPRATSSSENVDDGEATEPSDPQEMPVASDSTPPSPPSTGPEARIGARVVKDELVRIYEVTLVPGGRRVTLDGKAARPLSKYFGGFNVVVFTPEDLLLARGAPGDRRRFLDRAVFNSRVDYLATVQDYEKVLKQRNAVLRQHAQGLMAPVRVEEMLQIYDVQCARIGLEIATARAHLVEEVRIELAQAFSSITHSEHHARARYVSKLVGQSEERIVEMHREGRMKDLATASTQLGPHRDDLAFELDERDAGLFASQGQLRAIMLAWKTAELAVLARVHRDLPILLLDDVSSELDPARNAYLFEHLATQAGQCFITTTHGGHVLLARDRADYVIQNGQISS